MVSGGGILGTSISSFNSIASSHEQGGTLGVTQAVSSIARIPGPLIGGYIFELAGVIAPFFLSVFMLMIATILGVRISFQRR